VAVFSNAITLKLTLIFRPTILLIAKVIGLILALSLPKIKPGCPATTSTAIVFWVRSIFVSTI
jgi:hypothetical protein